MNIKLFDKISKEKKLWLRLFMGWFLVGIVTSVFDSSLKASYIYVIGINGLLFLQVIADQALKIKESKLRVSLVELGEIENSPISIINKFGAHLDEWYSIAVSFGVGVIYIASLILQKVLSLNAPITLYGSITLILTVFIAIQLLLKYVLYTLALREIAKVYPTTSKEKLFKSVWILNFEELLKLFSVYFALFGVAYTLLFDLTQNGIQTYAYPAASVVTWGIIVLVIVFGWVILNTARMIYIKRIIAALDSKQEHNSASVETRVDD